MIIASYNWYGGDSQLSDQKDNIYLFAVSSIRMLRLFMQVILLLAIHKSIEFDI